MLPTGTAAGTGPVQIGHLLGHVLRKFVARQQAVGDVVILRPLEGLVLAPRQVVDDDGILALGQHVENGVWIHADPTALAALASLATGDAAAGDLEGTGVAAAEAALAPLATLTALTAALLLAQAHRGNEQEGAADCGQDAQGKQGEPRHHPNRGRRAGDARP